MNAFILKIIAMITMLIDHVGAVFNLSDVLRCIGRTSFPLYALMVVDGCSHLRKDEKRLRKYMIFMIVMAIASLSFGIAAGRLAANASAALAKPSASAVIPKVRRSFVKICARTFARCATISSFTLSKSASHSRTFA